MFSRLRSEPISYTNPTRERGAHEMAVPDRRARASLTLRVNIALRPPLGAARVSAPLKLASSLSPAKRRVREDKIAR